MFSIIAVTGCATLDQTSRIIANVLVGIGFLGASAVLKDEMGVHDLTTAVSKSATCHGHRTSRRPGARDDVRCYKWNGD